MDISTIFTFTIATALIVAIPGPSILMIVAAGVAGGRRAAIGGLVLVLLGLRMLRARRAVDPSRVSAHAHSLGSFIATITNPKSLLFFAAFLPQFIDPSRPVMPQYLMLAALFFLAGTPVALAYALSTEWLTDREGPLGRISALAPRLAGLCLIALGATSMVRIFW